MWYGLWVCQAPLSVVTVLIDSDTECVGWSQSRRELCRSDPWSKFLTIKPLTFSHMHIYQPNCLRLARISHVAEYDVMKFPPAFFFFLFWDPHHRYEMSRVCLEYCPIHWSFMLWQRDISLQHVWILPVNVSPLYREKSWRLPLVPSGLFLRIHTYSFTNPSFLLIMPSKLYQADDFILNTTGSMNNNAQSSENNLIMIEMSPRMIY